MFICVYLLFKYVYKIRFHSTNYFSIYCKGKWNNHVLKILALYQIYIFHISFSTAPYNVSLTGSYLHTKRRQINVSKRK